MHRQLQIIRKVVPPRVSAAVMSTLLNRWTTTRRMRKVTLRARCCLLGCSRHAADSLEHYLGCPLAREWLARRLRLDPADLKLESWLLAVPKETTTLIRLAVGTYVLYRATNHLKHRWPIYPDTPSSPPTSLAPTIAPPLLPPHSTSASSPTLPAPSAPLRSQGHPLCQPLHVAPAVDRRDQYVQQLLSQLLHEATRDDSTLRAICAGSTGRGTKRPCRAS